MKKFSGTVKKHLGRGKKLGFPTANIEAPKEIEDGIYAAKVHFNTRLYCSIVFVGRAETFGETRRNAEAYILDFSGSLYGQEIEITLIKKLRENKKFESEQALVEQMHADEQVAREFFKNYT